MSAPKNRCPWCQGDPLYVDYHDKEWGVPLHDDRRLFEMLILEGAQAGLSWLTILRKRENYRQAFDHFDCEKVARYTDHDIQRLLADAGIVRNRLKIAAAIKNAQAVLELKDEFGSLDTFFWRYVDGQPLLNRWKNLSEIPARTDLSDIISKDLNLRGFKFVGSTICYAFMQSIGMVNDHLMNCFRYHELKGETS
ncbi:DNA-3-methyladenine glycosylase I [Tichowtungia aerotolerans]|uniref:DNA-3-methyladenine glycosylase I n=1 Tax=Tichowtungia aerotolerans TaxID=2697043 RepID=A0A6P1M620_9BACT|nr:DNA-3-methyladenine glycosylase I [Tichowtungia aerotolerans]QHI70030.1 DNA-3-methyladenine glycosylase I [Tichowtungia aerotolerans]